MTTQKLKKTAKFYDSIDMPFRILNPLQSHAYYTLSLYEPMNELKTYVELIWVMRWDLVDGEFFDAEVIPSAYTNLTCMPGGARVTGVTTGRYQYRVEGNGVIFGVMFRPGGLYQYSASRLSDLTDSTCDAEDIFKFADNAFNSSVLQSSDLEGMFLMQNQLLGITKSTSSKVGDISKIIEFTKNRPDTTVKGVSKEFRISERKIQALFDEQVGVGLKWIMLRNRILKAAELTEASSPTNWSQVASDLGYSDQAHLINDFKKITGKTPANYAKTNNSST
jgi:AraC-like DNA-binding protein